MADTINCPKCQNKIEVTEVLSAQLRSQLSQEFEAESKSRDAGFAKKEALLKLQQAALAEKELAIQQEIAQQVKRGRKKLRAKAIRLAREAVSTEIQLAQAETTELRGKLQEAKQTELQLRKDRQSLEEEKQNLELTVTRRLDEQRAEIRDKAKREALEEHRLKTAEKEEQIRGLREQIEILKLKSEQGSQQLQGEVLELDLEAILRQHFRDDDLMPVPKGVFGGDIVHVVRDGAGGDCGSILWESKRTKNWSDKWLEKLRSDQRAAKAHIAILVSDELPKVITTFGFVDEVWVTNRACFLGLALALRAGMLQLAEARRSLEGQQGKMSVLYNYLSSPQFRHRVGGIIEAFTTLREDLEDERRAVNRLWAKREKQINQAMLNTTGMYGDLQGIIGGNLPTMENLEIPALPAPEGEAEESLKFGVLPR